MAKNDLILLLAIPVLLIIIIISINNKSQITGAAVSAQEDLSKNNQLGVYSVVPSFRAKIDYNMDYYGELKQKLESIIDECGKRNDMEECVKGKTADWDCVETEENSVLYNIMDRLNECFSLGTKKAVCEISLEKMSFKETRNFEIILKNTFSGVDADLREKDKLLNSEILSFGSLIYTDNKAKDETDTEKLNLPDSVRIKISYNDGIPEIKEISAIKEKSATSLSKSLVYKTGDAFKFIDSSEEYTFREIPDVKITRLPKLVGLKFCAKSGKEITYYDNSENKLKTKEVLYKFAVTFPKSAPKPIGNLEAIDMANSENSVILTWDKNEDDVKSYNIYYSTDGFAAEPMSEIKKDSVVKAVSISSDAEAVENIDLSSCKFDKISEQCKFDLYNKPLQKNKLYFWNAKNKFIYIVSSIKNDVDYNFAVASVDEDGKEIDNDKSIEGNTQLLVEGQNYKTGSSKDDLAPGKTEELKIIPSSGKLKINWKKPLKNIDGTDSSDIKGFYIYKKLNTGIPANLETLMSSDPPQYVTLEQACGSIVNLYCNFELVGLKPGLYNFAATAVDVHSNEYRYPDFTQFAVT